MNLREKDVLLEIYSNGFTNQRNIATAVGHSLGIVNKSIKNLIEEDYLDENFQPTKKTIKEVKDLSPKNAIILAAGYGMRIESINKEIPKGLLNVKGELLIERTICQLREKGIKEIYVVVGFLKEQYEYLIDKFGVKLVISRTYKKTNSLHSLNLLRDKINNTYIIPCDLWMEENPFSKNELYSWYMVSDEIDEYGSIRSNRKRELVSVATNEQGNTMVGISYISSLDSEVIKERLSKFCMNKRYNGAYWEEVLYNSDNKLITSARIVESSKFIEINSYDQLCAANGKMKMRKSNAIKSVCSNMGFTGEITNEHTIKRGITNLTIGFECMENKYVIRIPEESSDFVNRENEKKTYEILKEAKIGERVIYFDDKTGYKVSEYIRGRHICDAYNDEDVIKCVNTFREFHNKKIQTDYKFDVFDYIEKFESDFKKSGYVYRDYLSTKDKILKMKDYIESMDIEYSLTHMDASANNILLDDNSSQGIIIDWEYAAMQDPHMDIALFAIRALYDRKRTDWLIDMYFDGKCPEETRYKIYAYMAVCGFMWSNWCEVYRLKGIDFGEYSMKQYRYAKEYSNIVLEHINK